MNKIRKTIIDIAKKLGEYDGSAQFYKVSQYGINSILLIKLIIMLESKFNIEFKDEELDFNKLDNIDELVRIIEKKL